MSFFAVDPDDWRTARQDLAGAMVWPRGLAVADLRYLQDQAMRPRGRFPSSRQLAKVWLWSQSRVRRLLADVDAWSDPLKREAWDAWYAQHRYGKSGGDSLVTQSRLTSESVVTHSRLTRPTSKVDNADSVTHSRLTDDSLVTHSRLTSDHTRAITQPQPQPPATTTETDTPLSRVWSHYREAWRRVHGASLNKAPPKRGGLSTVIREHGEAKTIELVDWWEQSPDDRATFLRERRIGHTTLFRPSKAASYLDEWVTAWRQGQADRFTATPKPEAVPNFARRFRVLQGSKSDVIDGA